MRSLQKVEQIIFFRELDCKMSWLKFIESVQNLKFGISLIYFVTKWRSPENFLFLTETCACCNPAQSMNGLC